jgi:3-methylcrotonyl-CoA carboxylase alpha subunit
MSIKRVFIANRGEIARRIALGARTLGIESAAIYSGDAPPAFLEGLVHRFIQVPEENPALYLNAELMVQFAQQSECDAVHPGFGFLSENARFASLVEEAGLIWVGPTACSISEMASKAEARDIAKAHQVPVVPGIERLPISADGSHLKIVRDFARQHGFPILLKAAMGGGGKGMRVVRTDEEVEEAIRRAQSEAINAFADGTLIVERYLEYPRHVEVQIFGDSHGNVLALGDRDCSVQRRHQKIIEEAPAPGLSADTRAHMHEAAIRLAKAVSYRSAGTVEFLVDWSPEQRTKAEQQFYFLEMNTRLQVEHPVTEQIFNEDLVAWQFRVANGETIKDRMHQTPIGHSIELRLYAEDTQNKFLPAPGPVHGFLPFHGPGIRWEAGIDPIDEVTPRFDPMMAKLVATGADRTQAIQRLIQSLTHTVLAIPTSNIPFLLAVLHHEAFAESIPTTRFIDEYLGELTEWLDSRQKKQQKTAERILQKVEQRDKPRSQHTPGILDLTRDIFQKESRLTDLEMHLPHVQQVAVPHRFRNRVAVLGRGLIFEQGHRQSFCFCQARYQGHRLTWVSLDGLPYWREEKPDDVLASGRSSAQGADICAPVPGKVVKVLVKTGDNVKERQIVAILESMKMEFEVQASRSGIIEEVLVATGQQVQADELLARWRVAVP